MYISAQEVDLGYSYSKVWIPEPGYSEKIWSPADWKQDQPSKLSLVFLSNLKFFKEEFGCMFKYESNTIPLFSCNSKKEMPGL